MWIAIAIGAFFIIAYFGINYVRRRFEYKQMKTYLDPNQISIMDARLLEYSITTAEELEYYMGLLSWVDSIELKVGGDPRSATLIFPDKSEYSRVIYDQVIEKRDLKPEMLEKIYGGEDPDWSRVK